MTTTETATQRLLDRMYAFFDAHRAELGRPAGSSAPVVDSDDLCTKLSWLVSTASVRKVRMPVDELMRMYEDLVASYDDPGEYRRSMRREDAIELLDAMRARVSRAAR